MPGQANDSQQPAIAGPSRPLGLTFVAIGVLIAIIGLITFAVVLPLGDDDAATFVNRLPAPLQIAISQIPQGTPMILLLLPGELISVAGILLIKHGRRHLAGKTHAHGDRKTILYLRPFLADASPMPDTHTIDWFLFPWFDMRRLTEVWLRLRGNSRYEELIAYAFRRNGTLVTIGDPRERLPLLGATRVYSRSPESTAGPTKDRWKTLVAEQIASAQFFLVHVGFSEAIRWEIESVIRVAHPRDIVLCVNPPGKPTQGVFRRLRDIDNARRNEIDAVWTQFRKSYGAIFPCGLPEAIGDARFIRFSDDWVALPLQPAKRGLAWFLPGGTLRARRDTVEGVLIWLSWVMVPERLSRRLARRFINFAVAAVAIVAGLAIVVALLLVHP